MSSAGNVEQQTKFQVGNYIADVLKANTVEDGWYVVVQPRHSRDIVAIDRFPTYEQARDAVMKTLEQLNQKSD